MTQKQILDNGLTILTDEFSHVRSVAVGFWLRQGSRHEPTQRSGIAHFMEHMAFKGTEQRSQAEIAQELDSLGGQSDAFTTQEYAGFHATVLDEHVPRAVDLLSDIVRCPRFDADEIERERTVISEEIRMVEDSPEELVHELFTESLWGDHPLGRAIAGSLESVETIQRQDLLDYFKTTYIPANLVVSAAGNIDHETFTRLVGKQFEDHTGSLARAVQQRLPRVTPSLCRREKDLEQAQLLVGAGAASMNDPDRFAGYVLDAVVGGNLSSRLFQVIREERGLAYSVYSSLTSFHDAGCFSIYAGTSPENLNEVMDCVLAELERVKTEPIGDDEISRAKDHLRGSILMGAETSTSRMAQIAQQEIHFGRAIPPEETIQAIDEVQAPDLIRIANAWLRPPLSVTVLGRLDGVSPFPEEWVA